MKISKRVGFDKNVNSSYSLKILVNLSFVSIVFLLFSNPLFGQTPVNVKGNIKWCKGSSIPNDIMVNLLYRDSVIQTAFTDIKGNFSFKDSITTDSISLRISYYGLILNQTQSKSDTLTQKGSKEKVFSISCQSISQHTKDSLLIDWDKKLLILYSYGYPSHSASEIRLVSTKYGVLYKNQGCIIPTNRDPVREENNKTRSILTKKLGKNWETSLWNEVEKSCEEP